MSFVKKYQKKPVDGGSFVAAIIRSKALVYHLTFPLPQGLAWYIIEIDSAKHKAFTEIIGKAIPLTLTDYGTILYSGWGDCPDEHLKATLAEKYGLYE